MKISLLVACAAACLATGAVVADDEVEVKADKSKPVELTAVQMDKITAGDLTTPGNKVFAGFALRNGNLHPTLAMGVGKEGPWHAHFNSPVITCADCGG